jgi:hypothetical protein
VFKNRVLRKIYGPKMDEVTGKLRRLHNQEQYDLYSSPNTVWVGHVVCIKDMRGADMVLVGRPERM